MILYCIITSLVNTLTSLVLCVAVLLKKTRDRKHMPFVWFALAVAFWSAFYFTWQFATSHDEALLVVRLLTASAIFTAITYFHFIVRLAERDCKREVQIGYFLAYLLAVLSATPYVVVDVRPIMMFPYWPKPGLPYLFYLGVFFYYTVRSWGVLFTALRRSELRSRNQLKFVLVGTAIGFVGGSTNFLLWYDIPVVPFGNGLVSVYVVAVGYAIVRFRLLEIDYLIVKLISYTLAVIPLAILFPLGAWIGFGFAVTKSQEKLVLVLVSIVVTAGLFWATPLVKRRIDRFLESTLMRGKFVGSRRLQSFASEISAIRDEESIFSKIVEVVSAAMNVQKAAVYIRGDLDARCNLKIQTGWPDPSPLDSELDEGHWLVRLGNRHRGAVVIDEQEREYSEEEWREVLSFKRGLNLDVIVPIYAENLFYGVMVLGPRRNHRLFSDLDLSLLGTICLQLGLNIRVRQMERRANQTEKLISLGTLAAGLAHELRNPLVSIQTFSALLDENAGDVEFQKEFSKVMLRDVNRIAGIVENVSSFATKDDVDFGPVQIDEVIRGALEIVQADIHEAGVQLKYIQREIPSINANYNQLLQVFINLMQNAVQAMDGAPESKLTVEPIFRDKDVINASVEVRVSDNGPGIDREVLSKVFEPFATTKDTGDRSRKGGLGLGLAIVKQIIDCHHGAIQVESDIGKGTTFIVSLPCNLTT
jgi:signal transduction histidine kinase